MRYALPGSVLVHTLALGAGLLALNLPRPDDAPAAQAVTVDIISIASVSSNQTTTIQSNATENLVSSGAKAVGATPPETIEPVKPDVVQPVKTPVQPAQPRPVKPVEAEPIDPVTTATTTPVQRAPIEHTLPAPATPVEPKLPTPVEPAPAEMALLSTATTQTLEGDAVPPVAVQQVQAAPAQPSTTPAPQPVEATDQKVAPVPHTLTRPRPTEPTKVAEQTPRPTKPKPPTPPKPQHQAQPRPAAPAGNGGYNQADSAASKPSGGQQANSGSGGDAAVARYPSQVVGKLRRALRYPGGAHGASGDVQVQFVVSANGQASGIRLVQSSGNAAIDQAALDTVRRAAPFPPIPDGANRSEWAFTVPLGFVRS